MHLDLYQSQIKLLKFYVQNIAQGNYRENVMLFEGIGCCTIMNFPIDTTITNCDYGLEKQLAYFKKTAQGHNTKVRQGKDHYYWKYKQLLKWEKHDNRNRKSQGATRGRQKSQNSLFRTIDNSSTMLKGSETVRVKKHVYLRSAHRGCICSKHDPVPESDVDLRRGPDTPHQHGNIQSKPLRKSSRPLRSRSCRRASLHQRRLSVNTMAYPVHDTDLAYIKDRFWKKIITKTKI